MAAVGRPTIIRARMTEDENGYKGFSAKEINGGSSSCSSCGVGAPLLEADFRQ